MLGVLPGIVGSLQAQRGAEARCSARASRSPAACCSSTRSHTTFDEVAIRRNPECPVCGDHPTITEYIDYVEFCSGAAGVHAV